MILERRPDDFSQRNLLLQVALGLLAAGRTLDELLASHVPAEPSAPGDPDDAGALFVLGLLAFSRRVQAVLAAVPAPPRRAPPPERPPLAEPLR